MYPVRMLHAVAQWMEGHALYCPIKQWVKVDCPGCGMQRSFAALLRGQAYASWQLHPGVWLGIGYLLLVAMSFWLPLRWRFRVIVGGYLAYTVGLLLRYWYLSAN